MSGSKHINKLKKSLQSLLQLILPFNSVFSGKSLVSIVSVFLILLVLLGQFYPVTVNLQTSNSGDYDILFQKNTRGGIIFSGNTLGLSASKESINTFARFDDKSPDYIDVFTSLNSSLTERGYPNGTTRDWRLNGSEANVSIPENSTVIHASLIWGGVYKHTNNPELDASNVLDTPVQFTTPQGSFQVAPNPRFLRTYTEVEKSVPKSEYIQTADVTEFVNSAKSGRYSLEGVPGILSRSYTSNNSPDNFNGWTLAIVFENPSYSLKNLTIFYGLQIISVELGDNEPAFVTNFSTPLSGDVKGKIHISSGEGDSHLTGDQLLFGRSVDTLRPLSGPNNRADNFFASQINNSEGNLDRTGTFGSLNYRVGREDYRVRQGWDLTSLDISNHLSNGQTSAVIKGTTRGDGYSINSIGLEIDILAAIASITLEVDMPVALARDVLTYKVTINNTGNTDATDITIPNITPIQTSFLSVQEATGTLPNYSADKNGTITIISLPPGATVSFSYKTSISESAIDGDLIKLFLDMEYSFVMGAGIPKSIRQAISNEVITRIILKQEVLTNNALPIPDISGSRPQVFPPISVNKNPDNTPTNILLQQPTPTETNLPPLPLFININRSGSIAEIKALPKLTPSETPLNINIYPPSINQTWFDASQNEIRIVDPINEYNNIILTPEQRESITRTTTQQLFLPNFDSKNSIFLVTPTHIERIDSEYTRFNLEPNRPQEEAKFFFITPSNLENQTPESLQRLLHTLNPEDNQIFIILVPENIDSETRYRIQRELDLAQPHESTLFRMVFPSTVMNYESTSLLAQIRTNDPQNITGSFHIPLFQGFSPTLVVNFSAIHVEMPEEQLLRIIVPGSIEATIPTTNISIKVPDLVNSFPSLGLLFPKNNPIMAIPTLLIPFDIDVAQNSDTIITTATTAITATVRTGGQQLQFGLLSLIILLVGAIMYLLFDIQKPQMLKTKTNGSYDLK